MLDLKSIRLPSRSVRARRDAIRLLHRLGIEHAMQRVHGVVDQQRARSDQRCYIRQIECSKEPRTERPETVRIKVALGYGGV